MASARGILLVREAGREAHQLAAILLRGERALQYLGRRLGHGGFGQDPGDCLDSPTPTGPILDRLGLAHRALEHLPGALGIGRPLGRREVRQKIGP
jgi:hypothetical protein